MQPKSEEITQLCFTSSNILGTTLPGGLIMKRGALWNATLQLVGADPQVIFSALSWPTSATQVQENANTCLEAQSDCRFVQGKPK